MSISVVESVPAPRPTKGRSKGEVWVAVTGAKGKWVRVTSVRYAHSVAAYYRKQYGFETVVRGSDLYLREV